VIEASDVNGARQPAGEQSEGGIEFAAVVTGHSGPVSQRKRACNRLDVDGSNGPALRSVKFSDSCLRWRRQKAAGRPGTPRPVRPG